MYYPAGISFDRSGNLYVGEWYNGRVRKITRDGIISTIAGGGSGGDGGPATAARLVQVGAVALDASANVFIGEAGGRIRKVSAANGTITTVAGGGTIKDSDGGPATAALLSAPSAITFDVNGDLYCSEQGGNRVRRINLQTGIITTVAGTGTAGSSGDGGLATAATLNNPAGLAFNSQGDLFIVDYANDRVRRVDHATGLISKVVGLLAPRDITVDSAGSLLVSVWGKYSIVRVDPVTGATQTIVGNGVRGSAGDGSPATAAFLRSPTSVAVDESGNLFVLERLGCRVRRVAADTGLISTFAGVCFGSLGDGGPATQATLTTPNAITIDRQHNLYVAENSRVRRIAMDTGIITTIAGTETTGFSGDGGSATTAQLNYALEVAVDAQGNVYFSDYGNKRIRKIAASTGIISTVAGIGSAGTPIDGAPATSSPVSFPYGLALDSAGNIYFTDAYWIRKINASNGTMTTIAGGASSSLYLASRIAFAPSGELHVFDYNRIRKLRSDGALMNVAGNGTSTYSGDGGPATSAGVWSPSTPGDLGGIAVDSSGNLFIAAGNRVRAVFACVNVTQSVPTSPANDSSGVSTSPSLTWKKVLGARYDVYIDRVSPPKTIAASDVNATAFSLSNLQPLTKYYWQIVAKGDPYCSPISTAPSEVWSFTTTGTCAPPSAISFGSQSSP